MDWDPSKLLDTVDGGTFVALLDNEDTQKWLEKTMCLMMRYRLDKLSVPRRVLAHEKLNGKSPHIRRCQSTDLILYDRDDPYGYEVLVQTNLRGEAIGAYAAPCKGWSIHFQQTRTERLQESAEKIEALEDRPATLITENMASDLADAENKGLFKLTEHAAETAGTFIHHYADAPSISVMAENGNIPLHGISVCGRETFDDLLKLPGGSLPEKATESEGDRFLGGQLFVLDYGRVPERTFYFYDTRREGKAGPMAEFKDPSFHIRKIFTDIQWQATNVRAMTLDCKRVGVYRYGENENE